MRFVIDNNQLSDIRKTTGLSSDERQRITLILPPLVWAEAHNERENLHSLLDYNVRFGRDVADVLQDIASTTDVRRRIIDPLVQGGSPAHTQCMRELTLPSPERLLRAGEIKEGNRGDMKRTRVAFSDKRRPELSKNHTSLDTVIAELASDFAITPYCAVGDDPSVPACTFAELLGSGNLRVVNFIRYYLCVYVAYHSAWKEDGIEPTLNSSPPEKQDHVPDMTLPLYAEANDVIVTKDKRFRRWFQLADVTGTIRVMTWDECLAILDKS